MLKTDYKDDVFTGNRKYNVIENSDGTKSLEDVTVYTQEGDTFSASDINSTNVEINGLSRVLEVELTNTTDSFFIVSVEGIKATDSPEIYVKTIHLSSVEEKQAVQEEFNKIVEATTGDNSITFILSEPLGQSITVYVKGK